MCLGTCVQVVASACAALRAVGVPAITAEAQSRGDSFRSSVLLLCSDAVQRCANGTLVIDTPSRQLLSDIIR